MFIASLFFFFMSPVLKHMVKGSVIFGVNLINLLHVAFIILQFKLFVASVLWLAQLILSCPFVLKMLLNRCVHFHESVNMKLPTVFEQYASYHCHSICVKDAEWRCTFIYIVYLFKEICSHILFLSFKTGGHWILILYHSAIVLYCIPCLCHETFY